MTGMELATSARYKLNPVVVVLNNRGYGTERHIQDGPYNDVWPWHYSLIPEVLGAGRGWIVETEEQRKQAAEIAAGVPGVRQVVNEIMLKPTPTGRATIRDPLGRETGRVMLDTNSPPPKPAQENK